MLKNQAAHQILTHAILTVEDLADYLECEPSTIYRLLDKGRGLGLRLEEGWPLKTEEFDPGYSLAARCRAKKSNSV